MEQRPTAFDELVGLINTAARERGRPCRTRRAAPLDELGTQGDPAMRAQLDRVATKMQSG